MQDKKVMSALSFLTSLAPFILLGLGAPPFANGHWDVMYVNLAVATGALNMLMLYITRGGYRTLGASALTLFVAVVAWIFIHH